MHYLCNMKNKKEVPEWFDEFRTALLEKAKEEGVKVIVVEPDYTTEIKTTNENV